MRSDNFILKPGKAWGLFDFTLIDMGYPQARDAYSAPHCCMEFIDTSRADAL
jgi:hypothetical protein